MTIITVAIVLAAVLLAFSHRAGRRGDYGMQGGLGAYALLVLIIACVFVLTGCAQDPYAQVHADWAAAHPPPAPPPRQTGDGLIEVLAGIAGLLLQGAMRP